MAFTDEEKREWFETKRKREAIKSWTPRNAPTAECIHCGRPFAHSDGYISDDFANCDICDGD